MTFLILIISQTLNTREILCLYKPSSKSVQYLQ